MNPRLVPVEMSAAVLAQFDNVIDTRSPAEYALDHIPGALNAPVLDDEERARVGTIYKQVSPFEARKLGAALVARNVSLHIENLFRNNGKGWRPLVYCWRGGMRSGAMAHVLREVGWEARTLAGGYKAYRRWVVGELDALAPRFSYRVVHGPTGSGKSRYLKSLAAQGEQVLDLEGLAAHRGSVLGALPGQPQPSQKLFESRLRAALAAFDAGRPVFVEAESKKIGQLQVPDTLIGAMRASECLRLETPLETRVGLLLDEYGHYLRDATALGAQLDCLVALHGHERVKEWKALAARGEWPALVERLLAEHYDPAYRRSSQGNFARLAQARVVRLRETEALAA